MSGERSCEEIEAGLIETFLAGEQPAAALGAHTLRCPACARTRAQLADLSARLDALAAPEPLGTAALDSIRRRVLTTLERDSRRARAPLPSGYTRELLRILGPAVAVLPVVLLWNAAVLHYADVMLADLLPGALRAALAAGYIAASAGWLALLFGSIPFVAHARVQRPSTEVRP